MTREDDYFSEFKRMDSNLSNRSFQNIKYFNSDISMNKRIEIYLNALI
jgi:hypothetical protein